MDNNHKYIFFILVLISFFSTASAKPYIGEMILVVQDKDLNQQVLKLESGSIIELRGGTLRNGVIECEGDLTIIGNGNTVSDFAFIKCNGNLSVSDVSFNDFRREGVFIEYSAATCKKPTIRMSNVQFDGCHKIDRFLRSYLNQNITEASIQIENCEFTKVTEYVIQFASNCTGRITNSKIYDIGNSNKSHVSGIWLGYQDEFLARGLVIDNNTVENICAPYNTKDDGREAHGIIVYGNNNLVIRNSVKNIYSIEGLNGDPGMDTEGIYLKGSNNEVAFNSVINATGSGSDGAITVKHNGEGKFSKNNSVHDNVISNTYSCGIVLYTDKSYIYNNVITLGSNSECGVEVFCGKTITINDNNVTRSKTSLVKDDFSGAIIVSKCKNVVVRHNTILNVPTLLNVIKHEGTLKIENNVMELAEGCKFGVNTKYTAGIIFQNCGKGRISLRSNTISGKGVRGSQLVEFTGSAHIKSIKLDNNELYFIDSQEQATFLDYVLRNVPTENVTVMNNIINVKGNYISSEKGRSFKRNVMEMSLLKNDPS